MKESATTIAAHTRRHQVQNEMTGRRRIGSHLSELKPLGPMKMSTRARTRRANEHTSSSETEVNALAKLTRSMDALTEVASMRRAIESTLKASRYVIDPHLAEWTHWWDLLMIVLLTVILFMTPYEVAFLPFAIGPLFYVNRVFDMVLLLDMVMQFFLSFQDTPEHGSVWVKNLPRIRKRYLRSWFLPDLVSILPFWLVPLILKGDMDSRSTAMARGIRATRLLRLFRLSRVFSMSRLIRKYETQVDVRYSVLHMARMMLLLIGWTHVQACIWGLAPLFQSAEAQTWLDELADDMGVPLSEITPSTKYIAAMCALPRATPRSTPPFPPPPPPPPSLLRRYWSCMTLTSIGYGEMLPAISNPGEQALCVVLMLASSIVWVYMMGQMCAIASTMDPDTTQFRNSLDSLNSFMRERGLNPELRVRLRTFYHNSRRMSRMAGDSDLMGRMSPLLRGTVALEAHAAWMSHVWYLSPSALGLVTGVRALQQHAFISHLAMRLRSKAFVREERIALGPLYILRKGLCSRGWYFFGPGRVWGEDMIISRPDLLDATPVVAMTYIETLSLTRDDLFDCAEEFPEAEVRIHRAASRILLMRILLKHLRISKRGEGSPLSLLLKGCRQPRTPAKAPALPASPTLKGSPMPRGSEGWHRAHPVSGIPDGGSVAEAMALMAQAMEMLQRVAPQAATPLLPPEQARALAAAEGSAGRYMAAARSPPLAHKSQGPPKNPSAAGEQEEDEEDLGEQSVAFVPSHPLARRSRGRGTSGGQAGSGSLNAVLSC